VSQNVIDEMIAPREESYDLVMQWIEKEELSNQAIASPLSDSVIVEASVSQIEKLLKAEYSAFGKIIFSLILRRETSWAVNVEAFCNPTHV
jgi:hypothetical protein